jgi:Kef-type K+ transport system membrane component KefB
MDTEAIFLQLALILFSARLFGEIAAYFQIPSVIGELTAGIILGPTIFNLVPLSAPIQLLAEIGIIFLLFEVGLETDLLKLTKVGGKSLGVAIVGVILPFVLGYLTSYYLFDLSFMISLFIASSLTATSIGITLRVLRDIKMDQSREAQIIIGAAVVDDIIGIILLSFLYEFAVSGEVNLFDVGKVMVFIAIYFLLAPLAAKLCSKYISRWDEKCEIPGLLPSTIVSLILIFSWLAHAFGAPELLGGFAAGLALSRQYYFPFGTFWQTPDHFDKKIESKMKPIIHLFSPIFFVAVGLALDLRSLPLNSSFFWLLSISLIVVAIIGKFLSGWALPSSPLKMKLGVGMAMIPRGEVGLIFANIGLTSNIFTSELYACIVLVVFITTLLPPFALKALYSQK